MQKPKTLCIDFDGVIHSYKSGWHGPRVICDEPVPGALQWLVELFDHGYQPCIYSSRSKYLFGIRAMKEWLFDNLYKEVIAATTENSQTTDEWKWKVIHGYQSMEIWDVHVYDACKAFIRKLKFPTKKPAAYLTIDDRAICFNGTFPTIAEMDNFKPWHVKERLNK
jgi:hypothetical protein